MDNSITEQKILTIEEIDAKIAGLKAIPKKDLSLEREDEIQNQIKKLQGMKKRKQFLEQFDEYYENYNKTTSLQVKDVSMRFNLSPEKVDDLKDFLIKKIKGTLHYEEYWALQNINFKINKGDHLGIMGLNGAGKSTLLKIIAGVMKPTAGEVSAKGKIVPLLELGAGFEPQYTGRENIFLYGTVLGYSKEFIQEKYNEIVQFSELGKFIDVPLKNYSSGMRARLGFSIATVVEPEILILDEVLSVGDKMFRKKCMAKMKSMFGSDVTVLFVSHSLQQVLKICNKGLLLEQGQAIAFGNIVDVAKIYEEKTGYEMFKNEITV